MSHERKKNNIWILKLDQQKQKYIINPSTTTITSNNTPIQNYKTKRRNILNNNKHYHLLSLDETALKYSNHKNNSFTKFLNPQNSIQESDTSSVLYHDYYCEDQSSLFDLKKNNLFKMQHSFNQEELSNNSLNKCYSNSKYSASIDINNVTSTSGSSTKLLTPKQLTFDDSYLVIIYNYF